MAKLYLMKITNGEMNEKTGEAWKLADVPVFWRSDVQMLLEMLLDESI